jgi:hypothetical protein
MFALAESEEEARVQLTMEQRDCTREKAVLLLDNARKNGNDRDRNLFCGCFLEDVLKEPRVLTEKCAFAVWGGG